MTTLVFLTLMQRSHHRFWCLLNLPNDWFSAVQDLITSYIKSKFKVKILWLPQKVAWLPRSASQWSSDWHKQNLYFKRRSYNVLNDSMLSQCESYHPHNWTYIYICTNPGLYVNFQNFGLTPFYFVKTKDYFKQKLLLWPQFSFKDNAHG